MVYANVPIVGVRASGKSTLLVSLISLCELYKIGAFESGRETYNKLFFIMKEKGGTLPGSTSIEKIVYVINKDPWSGKKLRRGIKIDARTIPGMAFTAITEKMSADEGVVESLTEEEEKLLEIVENPHAIIYVTDLTQLPKYHAMHQLELNASKIETILVNQFLPMLRVIAYINRKKNTRIPLFWVFTKYDVHQMLPLVLKGILRKELGLGLKNIYGYKHNVFIYTVVSRFWLNFPSIRERGYGIVKLLHDLIHVV